MTKSEFANSVNRTEPMRKYAMGAGPSMKSMIGKKHPQEGNVVAAMKSRAKEAGKKKMRKM